MDPEIILFTYDISVFGRRMDWYLTLRGLKYNHCIQPNRMPRPDLKALGVAYRKIPVLAIGRDIYCDTRLIIEKLEQLFPDSRLDSQDKFGQGVGKIFESWTIVGGPFLRTAQLIPENAPIISDQKWLEDRSEMSGRPFSLQALRENRPDGLAHARLYFDTFENYLLADGRKFILNTEEPTSTDIHAIWTFDWTLQMSLGMEDALEKEVISKSAYPKVYAWVDRFRKAYKEALKKNGKPNVLSSQQTIDKILASDFFEKEGIVDESDPVKVKKGQQVEIWPTDSGSNHHDKGELVALGAREVVIAAKPNAGNGTVRLHFPRETFKIIPVKEQKL